MPPNNAIVDFGIDWHPIKSSVKELADSEAGSAWAKNIIEYSDRTDDELLRIDNEAGQEGARLPAVADNLYRIYNDFRYEARFHFLVVDQSLKSDCEALVPIGAPLQALLKAVDADD